MNDKFIGGLTHSKQGGFGVLVLHLRLSSVVDAERAFFVDVCLEDRHYKGICGDVHDDQVEDL